MIVFGALMASALTVVALFAPAIAPYDPRELAGPSFESPSAEHLLGTNDIGQDIFSQIVWGSRPAITMALGAAVLALVLGCAVGLSSALIGGFTDTLTMRVVDIFLAIPQLPLLVLLAALAGPSQANLIVIIGLIRWPMYAREVRSQALTVRQRGFIRSARGFGGGVPYVVVRHLVPAIGPLVVLLFVAGLAHALLLEASLAFLGLSDPTAVSWGLMVNRALFFPGLFFTSYWVWWLLPAGFAITLGVLGFMILGVGLEPVFNPRWQRSA